MSGVFITKGMTLTIPAGGLTLAIDDDGKLKGSSLTLHVQYDVCPTWLDLASRHLADADQRRLARITAWQSDDADARAATLEKEFESSMQAMMAGAVALDSFYLALRDKTNIPRETIQVWREKRTARYKQVAEVLRCAFALPNRGSVALRGRLKEIFKFRDLAVHPSAAPTAPVLHPELQTGVEWRFAAFRAENARIIVRTARSIIDELVTKGKPTTPEIARYADGLRNQLAASGSTGSG
jgi:hypothetical protein